MPRGALIGLRVFAHRPSGRFRQLVQQIQPSSEPAVGDEVVMTGNAFASSSNAVRTGPGYLHNLASARGHLFALRASDRALGVCSAHRAGVRGARGRLTPGTYRVAVINAKGTSNEVTLQVVPR